MRWRGGRQSTNIEDRRGLRPQMAVGGGGLGLVVILVLALFFGVNPLALLQSGPPGGGGLPGLPGVELGTGAAGGGAGLNDELREFVAVVLGDTEDVWSRLLPARGVAYRPPKLVLFSGSVQSACGMASSATGPFYCPADEKVYLDASFFDELSRRFGAPGDFAQAYVIAHEIGHHVQNLLGATDRVHRQRGRVSETEYNRLSVRLELQADFYAGVWAHHAQRARRILEAGDIDEGIRAASAIGDDRLQMQSQGYVVPDAFTHGTSEQRARWFRKGLETGDLSQGDTFGLPDP